MSEEKTLTIELDLLPENKHYRDEGCELAASCLDCPFPRCVFETSNGKRKLLKRRRDDEIARVYREERLTYGELARMFKVSSRTIQRVLKVYGLKRHGKK